MGALPNKTSWIPGCRPTTTLRGEVRGGMGRSTVPAERWSAPHGSCSRRWRVATCEALYIIGENPVRLRSRPMFCDRPSQAARVGSISWLVQDIFLTKTAEMADVVLPAAASWAETDGHGHQLERAPGAASAGKALEPPGEARDDIDIICDRGETHGAQLGCTRRRKRYGTSCDPCRRCTAGMAYTSARGARRDLQWPCPDEDHPGTQLYLHSLALGGPDAARSGALHAGTEHGLPRSTELSDDFPIRLTTGRRLGFVQHRRPKSARLSTHHFAPG